MTKMNQKGIGTILVLFLILVICVVGFAGWIVYRGNANQSGKSSCAEIKDHSDRFDCYLNDADAKLLQRAINENNPALCDHIDHVFTPHDVLSDIENGIIGGLVYGKEAKQQCRTDVESGHRFYP